MASLASAADRIAARIGGETVSCEALGAARPAACATALLQELRARAERQYIHSHRLHASSAEIAAVRAYESAFARHDRDQRTRKLHELETRLIHMEAEMSDAERERLVQFRAVLLRLASFEADVDHGIEAPPAVAAATITHWIEQAKLDAALYHRYGGVVGVKPSGPYAHAARAALMVDYMRAVAVEIPDAEVEQRLRTQLHQAPAIVHSGPVPDFTPFWQRPLLPSYVGP